MNRTYTTVQGDMWDVIAYRELGNSKHTGVLIAANMQHRNFYIFPAGVVLTLPGVDDAGSDVGNMPPWKQVSG